MKNKIVILPSFILFVLFFSINIVNAADTCVSSGRKCMEIAESGVVPSCSSGMQITASYSCDNKGYGLYGAVCCEKVVASEGGAYEAVPENYNPGNCPNPGKEYRDLSGNCVEYESGYETPAAGYDPTNSGVDVYGNRPGLDCSSGVCFPTSTSLPDPSGGVAYIIGNVLTWILSIFGFLAIIAFIISGIQYTLSAGDEKMIDTAKRNMTWSIVGVAVALAGVVIIYAIDKMLRGTPNF
jgi:hypothetical protein